MTVSDRSHLGFFARLRDMLSGGERLRLEKSRLESFLGAIPGAYCGFSPDGTVAYNETFLRLIGARQIAGLADIQAALDLGDAAALESLMGRLRDNAKPFHVRVRTADGARVLRLTGTRGRAVEQDESFDVLWAEDITAYDHEKNALQQACLKQQEELERLRSGLDGFDMPAWRRDATGTLVWCNRAYAILAGTTPETVVADGKEIPLSGGRKLVADTPMPGPALARRALETKTRQEAEAHVIRGGARRWMKFAEMPLPDGTGTVGTAFDVTREEELANELKRSSTANRDLLEQLRSAIGIFGADQKIEFYNSAFSQLWDLPDPWLATKPRLGDIMERLREHRRLPEQADFRNFKQGWLSMFTDLIRPHEDMLHLPDGKALRMLVVPHPMGGLMMTFEDVTSRLELESSYNTLIAVQKETLDNLAEGVAVWGPDGRLKLWNPEFASLWSLNPEDLEGEPHVTRIVERLASLFARDEWDAQRTQLMAMALERSELQGRMDRLDGRIVEYATVPLPDGGVLMTHFDVTDSARVEAALRDKNAALEAAERLKLDFLANVSYQLRTPLNAIMGFSEILGHEYFGALNPRQKEYTGGIQEAGERLIELIDDILDLSTIEAGYLELNRAPVDIAAMLSTLLSLTKDWARKENITVSLTCPRDIGAVEADERRLKQVLLNLIRNAIRFTPEGGLIEMRAAALANGIEIAVRDNGIGIAPEDQARVFEPFERVQSPAQTDGKQARGAGLGLTLVRNIVSLHGGAVRLDSAPGEGTSVIITLPRDGHDDHKEENHVRI